jgi:hypothetical protein
LPLYSVDRPEAPSFAVETKLAISDIKVAVVERVAGSVAGHGKAGAAAGCEIGHHEASKADAENAKA